MVDLEKFENFWREIEKTQRMSEGKWHNVNTNLAEDILEIIEELKRYRWNYGMLP